MKQFHQKIYERAIARPNNEGLNAAVTYILAVVAGAPDCAEKLLSSVKNGNVEPFATTQPDP